MTTEKGQAYCEKNGIKERIAKTISFMAGEQMILIVTAGDMEIDILKYKALFGRKGNMISPEEAEALAGYAGSGICPFGVKESTKVYLDISLKRFERVFPACGSAGSDIELTIPELEQYSGYAGWVDVCKRYEI